jgi:uncharacterized protein (TIGR02246 family)
MKKTILFAMFTGLFFSTATAQDRTADRQAIQNIAATMQKGWNEKSGKTFASPFATTHDYVVVNGMYFSGMTPERNAQAHQNLFNGVYRTRDLELRIDKISFIRDDLAMVHVLGAGYDQGTAIPENPQVVITMLVEKKNSEWKIISFHNCDIEVSFEPGAQTGSPMPLKVMYASWYK